jgi:hypothetical protein
MGFSDCVPRMMFCGRKNFDDTILMRIGKTMGLFLICVFVLSTIKKVFNSKVQYFRKIKGIERNSLKKQVKKIWKVGKSVYICSR